MVNIPAAQYSAFALVDDPADRNRIFRSGVYTLQSKLVILRRPVASSAGQYRFFGITPGADMDVNDIRREIRSAAELWGDKVDHAYTLVLPPTSADAFQVMIKFKDNCDHSALVLSSEVIIPAYASSFKLLLPGTHYTLSSVIRCFLCQGGLHYSEDCPLQKSLGPSPAKKGRWAHARG
ncbi:hypothetical protein BD626DRAFT_517463 [Schizophyllum amplum]|uniref:Uncharacterized protein n=1 Tax=Schizophyllum amplum TaxID=97359 RepID=A0A550BWB0_9AGAR|nr:hypothetical protein BD626DRAFT_517463 [Auriculariopsis ampla]